MSPCQLEMLKPTDQGGPKHVGELGFFHPGRRSAMWPPELYGNEFIHRLAFLRTRRHLQAADRPEIWLELPRWDTPYHWPCLDECCGDRLAAADQSTAAVARVRPRLAGQPEESDAVRHDRKHARGSLRYHHNRTLPQPIRAVAVPGRGHSDGAAAASPGVLDEPIDRGKAAHPCIAQRFQHGAVWSSPHKLRNRLASGHRGQVCLVRRRTAPTNAPASMASIVHFGRCSSRRATDVILAKPDDRALGETAPQPLADASALPHRDFRANLPA